MRRLPLFEFEDQPWCPAVLRNAVTAYLRFVVRMTRQVEPVVPALADLLRRSGETGIVDLCSGSGGIAGQLAAGLAGSGLDARLLLTDLYPDTAAFESVARESGGRVAYRREPLDATAVPRELAGVRTIFNAFHHFEPDAARRVLRDAAEARRPIAVVEFVERSAFTLSGVLMSPLLVLLVAPFLKPRRPLALFFTYVVPLVPLIVLWDGLASWLRVYSPDELREMAASASAPGYDWELVHWRVGPTRVTCLRGCPT